MSENDTLSHWKNEFWQIQRMHMHQIKITFEMTPDHSVPMWYCDLYIEGTHYSIARGHHLWKRFKQAVEICQERYGDNLYNYQAKPLN